MDKIKLTPTKGAYRAVKADVDENAGAKELTDNGIDNARRQGKKDVTVNFRHETDKDGSPVLIIEDDSGGLPRGEMSMVFGLGQSEKEEIDGSIGAFGIGSKKALMCLGNMFTIRSRATDADTGYEYTIDQEWLSDDDEWEAELVPADLQAGTTEIEIRELNFTWADLRDHLEADLKRTYELYLSGEAPVTLRLLFPNEENTKQMPLSPPPRPAYSYTQWDGLYPRRYKGIVLDPEEVTSPVHVEIEVGLLATGDGDAAGVDWICQNRVVERANRDEVSGFGDELSKFVLSKHKRLKARVKLYTSGDASELPWNSDKSRIHARHPVTVEVRDVLRRVIDRYMKAGYGEVDPEFFEPFTEDSQHAANGGRIDVTDLTESYQRLRKGEIQQVSITDKPDEGFPLVTVMQETADAHAQLGISYEYLDWVKPWMRPTYHNLTEARREKHGCFDSLEALESPPPDFTEDGRSGEAERARLTELARISVNQGVRYTELTEWEQPRYTRELEAAAADRELDVESLTPTDVLPTPEEDEEPEEDELSETIQISFGEFTEDELTVLNDHLGDIREYSPEKRKEALLAHFRRLNVAGIRFEASAD